MKKKICLITDWFPTKNNPYQGLFFKEQAIAVREDFDFMVVRYHEYVSLLPFGKYYSEIINKYENIVEYSLDVHIPAFVFIMDIIKSNIVIMTKKGYVDGIGSYASCARKRIVTKVLKKAFTKSITEKFDALYCVDAQKEAYLLQVVSKLTGKPYVVGEHAPVPWTGRQIMDINKLAIEKANCYLAISKDKIRQLMLQNIWLPKIVYLGNMIDENRFQISKKNDTTKTLLIVAANSYYKNYGMFISVMDRLCEITVEAFNIMIVGYASNSGYSKDVEKFEEDIQKSKFYKNTSLIREIPHSEIQKVYNKADAFVMTSIQEGQPVSALEAACCGLPIFSTRCGGVEDYVDESIGRIYDVDDIEGFAQGLKEFIESSMVFNQEHIREKVVGLFGKKVFLSKFKEVFVDCIEGYE